MNMNSTRYEEGWIFHTHAWELLHEIIRTINGLHERKTILDFGAGPGIAASIIQTFFVDSRVYVTDIDESNIDRWADRNLIGEVTDITSATFNRFTLIPDHYDVIVCSHVLEHVDNIRLTLSQLSSRAKTLILVVPDGHVDDDSHKRLFDRVSFKGIIDDTLDYTSISYYPSYHPHINNLVAVIQ